MSKIFSELSCGVGNDPILPGERTLFRLRREIGCGFVRPVGVVGVIGNQ